MKFFRRKVSSSITSFRPAQVEFADPTATPVAETVAAPPPGAAVRQRVGPATAPPRIHPHKAAPDYEEGPHSQIGEDEFFDAVEVGDIDHSFLILVTIDQ